MISDEEKKAIERIEDFLTTNIIISISSNETANSEELKAFISKNEYLSIEFISTMFLKQSKEIEELNLENIELKQSKIVDKNSIPNQDNFYDCYNFIHKDKIKAKIEEVDYKMIAHQDVREAVKQVLQSLLEKE